MCAKGSAKSQRSLRAQPRRALLALAAALKARRLSLASLGEALVPEV